LLLFFQRAIPLQLLHKIGHVEDLTCPIENPVAPSGSLVIGGVVWINAYLPYPNYLSYALVAEIVLEDFQVSGDLLDLIVDYDATRQSLVPVSVPDSSITVVVREEG
jgi:hypothetical protein